MNGAELSKAIQAGVQEIRLQAGTVSFELTRIPPGEFDLGSPDQEEGHQPNEGPVRRIRISKPFYLGRFEVTQAQYKSVTGLNPSNFEGPDLAMDQITYPKAVRFCELVTAHAGVRVTLPTEAQWEYACRAGTKTCFYSGNSPTDLDRVAWHSGNSGGRPQPVGRKEPNAFGLYDMLGNVWELCSDFLPDYSNIQVTDPAGRDTAGPAMRGGGWMDEPRNCRSATRLASDVMFGGTGVRIAVNP
jgi:formylglycine-generating enzyme required for sulfatase activity